MTARVIELTTGSRAFVDERGDVTIVQGALSLSLRRREIEKLIRGYRPKAAP